MKIGIVLLGAALVTGCVTSRGLVSTDKDVWVADQGLFGGYYYCKANIAKSGDYAEPVCFEAKRR